MKCACPFCGETIQASPFKRASGWKFQCIGSAAKPHGRMTLYLESKEGAAVPSPAIAGGALSAAKSLLERAKRLGGKGEV